MFQIPDNVSKYDNVFDVLQERGLIEQCTNPFSLWKPRTLTAKSRIPG